MSNDPAVRCKVCAGSTEIHGHVDANRSCEIARGTYLPLIGTPVLYHRCQSCGFIFTADFDGWSVEEFAERIYGSEYAAADPDYFTGVRARHNAVLVQQAARSISANRILDYGGGEGILARICCQAGFEAASWDVMVDNERPQGQYELVSAFEVFEHTPTPIGTITDVMSFLLPGKSVLFSTLVLDDVARQATDHWYIAPKNGHISLHTRASLRALFAPFGYAVRNFSQNLHVAEYAGVRHV